MCDPLGFSVQRSRKLGSYEFAFLINHSQRVWNRPSFPSQDNAMFLCRQQHYNPLGKLYDLSLPHFPQIFDKSHPEIRPIISQCWLIHVL